MKLLHAIVISLIILPAVFMGKELQFSPDSSYSYINHLSKAIGPRTMGSPNEAAALKWAVTKYIGFGADSAYIMPFYESLAHGKKINTRSGIAVAVFKGKSDSAIVIGGHIDSAGEEYPGANDDGSGSATVLELARIWSQRARHYTMVFCNFGGEERGLLGSKHFVEHYKDLDKVVLMVSADMAGSEEDVIAMIETDKVQAPKWLVEDAFRIAGESGYSQLYYPTRFSILNHLSKNGAGSDHMSFLEKGIPAIDFTAGINDSPIHSAQDKIDFITLPMLQKYGQFIDQLLINYQEHGVPAMEEASYFLWDGFAGLIFIPKNLLIAINIIAFFLGLGALFYARKQRVILPKEKRVRWSGWKLFFILVMLAIFTQLGEGFLQFFKGLRFPWYYQIYPYLTYAAIWLFAGGWVALQLSKRWKFSKDGYPFVLRAIVILSLFLILSSLLKANLAFYPALALILLSIAVFSRPPIIKTISALLSPLPLLLLLFHEMYPFFARMSAGSGFAIDNFVKAFFYSAGITAFLVFWFLPFIYAFGFAAVSNKAFTKILKKLRQPIPGYAILGVVVIFGGYLFATNSYTEKWRPGIHVDGRYELPAKKSTLKISGNEYFKDVEVKSDSLNGVYDSDIHSLDVPTSFELNWLTFIDSSGEQKGNKDTVSFDWSLISDRRWLRIDASVVADSGHIEKPEADVAFTAKDSLLGFSWSGGYKDTLRLKGKYLVERGSKQIRKISAVYADKPVAIDVKSDLANVRYRTTIVYRDTLH